MSTVATLMMDAASLAACAFSPSKTCRVRVSSTRYRHDPYRAKVMPSPFKCKTGTPTFVAPVALKPRAEVERNAAPLAPKETPRVVAAPAAKEAPAPKYALVGFKHEACMYQAPFRVNVGDHVVVEADRGEHVGVVVDIVSTPPKYNVPSRIVRRASTADVQCLRILREREEKTTTGVQKLSESLGLGIKIVDTEFQVDGNKLTVFFASKCFVDFRKLQRSLFREHHCRIWLVNWAEVRPYQNATTA